MGRILLRSGGVLIFGALSVAVAVALAYALERAS